MLFLLNVAGDSTEDPSHLKKVWPTQRLCPKCSLDAAGTVFDKSKVAMYMSDVYNIEADHENYYDYCQFVYELDSNVVKVSLDDEASKDLIKRRLICSSLAYV